MSRSLEPGLGCRRPLDTVWRRGTLRTNVTEGATLVSTPKSTDRIHVAENVIVARCATSGGRVRPGVQAPPEIGKQRGELPSLPAAIRTAETETDVRAPRLRGETDDEFDHLAFSID